MSALINSCSFGVNAKSFFFLFPSALGVNERPVVPQFDSVC